MIVPSEFLISLPTLPLAKSDPIIRAVSVTTILTRLPTGTIPGLLQVQVAVAAFQTVLPFEAALQVRVPSLVTAHLAGGLLAWLGLFTTVRWYVSEVIVAIGVAQGGVGVVGLLSATLHAELVITSAARNRAESPRTAICLVIPILLGNCP